MKKLIFIFLMVITSLFSFGNTIINGVSNFKTPCVNAEYKYWLEPATGSDVDWSIQGANHTNHLGLTSDTIYITWTEVLPGQSSLQALTLAGQNIASIILNVKSIPVPTLTGSNNICQGTQVEYITEPNMSNYIWNVPNNSYEYSSTDHSKIKVTWTNSGNNSVSVSYDSPFGCRSQNPTLLPVTVNAKPNVSILGDNSVCGGEHTYSTSISYPSYKWSVNGGGYGVNGSTSATYDINWVFPNSTGIVGVEVVDNHTCKNTSQLAVVVQNVVIPSLLGNPNSCVGTSNTYSTDENQSEYVWQVNGGSIISGQGTNTINVLWTVSGYPNLSVSYKSPEGCMASKSVSINVSTQPISNIVGVLDTIYNSNSIYHTNPNMTNYTWKVVGGDILSDSTNSNINVHWSTIGTGSISVNFNNNGCVSNTTTKSIILTPSICMITYDSTENFNRIYFNTIPDTFAYYNIYKWNDVSTWEKIGEISADSTTFLDTTSVPYQSPYKYKISVSTPESSLSPEHKTIWLHYEQTSQDLMWTEYKGYEFDSYEIWRKVDQGPWELIATKPNDNLVYTDNYIGGGVRSYFIQVIPFCTPNLKSSNYTIKSNVQKIGINGIFENKVNSLKVYPNPTRDNLTVDLKNGINYIEIYDMNGKILFNTETADDKLKINVSSYTIGLYLIKVKNGYETYLGKFQKVN